MYLSVHKNSYLTYPTAIFPYGIIKRKIQVEPQETTEVTEPTGKKRQAFITAHSKFQLGEDLFILRGDLLMCSKESWSREDSRGTRSRQVRAQSRGLRGFQVPNESKLDKLVDKTGARWDENCIRIRIPQTGTGLRCRCINLMEVMDMDLVTVNTENVTKNICIKIMWNVLAKDKILMVKRPHHYGWKNSAYDIHARLKLV